jgi:hypothetical protein
MWHDVSRVRGSHASGGKCATTLIHVEISHFANPSPIAGFIEWLVARSRSSSHLFGNGKARCAKNMPVALVRVFRRREKDEVKALVKSHLLDNVTVSDPLEVPQRSARRKGYRKPSSWQRPAT